MIGLKNNAFYELKKKGDKFCARKIWWVFLKRSGKIWWEFLVTKFVYQNLSLTKSRYVAEWNKAHKNIQP
jgi:hypothetical protein